MPLYVDIHDCTVSAFNLESPILGVATLRFACSVGTYVCQESRPLAGLWPSCSLSRSAVDAEVLQRPDASTVSLKL